MADHSTQRTRTFRACVKPNGVDGRILNVQTGAVLPGSSISVSGKYPEQCSVALSQLASRVMTALKLPDVAGQAQKIEQLLVFRDVSKGDTTRWIVNRRL